MVLHKKFFKQIALLTASTVICSNVVAVQAKDHIGHWAEEAITEWTSLGIIKGYEDGTIRPSQPLTRAELASIISRVFGLNHVEKTNYYTDVAHGSWYQHPINLVMSADIMNDYGSEFKPSQLATREEAAFAFARAYHLTGKTDKKFIDSDLVSEWAKDEVDALISNGYLAGRTDGTLSPQDALTRAECIAMLDKLTAELYQAPGTYTGEIKGNVVISSSDVVLKDISITGNLYIAEGVGEGDITLENAKITGNVIVEGGGEHSIKIKDSAINNIYVDKANGAVRVALDAKSKVTNMQVNSTVQLEGAIENLEVLTEESVKLVDAAVKNLKALALGSNINIDKNSVVEEFVADAAVTIEGKGKINKALINVDNVIINDVEVNKNGVVIKDTVKNPPKLDNGTGSSGGSGGSSSGGSTGGSTGGSGSNSGGSSSGGSGGSSSGGSTEKPETKPEVLSVSISGSNQVLVEESVQLIVTVKTNTSDTSYNEVTWSIQPTSLKDATITEDGIFKAGTTPGKVTVVATSKKDTSKYATHEIEVIAKDDFVSVESISLNYDEVELPVGEQVQLEATIQPLNATNKEVSWHSNNTGIATVDEQGRITAVSAGVTEILVTTLDGEHSAKCSIVVTETEVEPTIVGVQINGPETMETESSIQLQCEVTATPDKDDYKEVNWEIKTPVEGVSIDQTGLLTSGTEAGRVTIVATSKIDPSKSSEYTIEIVKKVAVNEIKISEKNVDMLLGDEKQLTAEVLPEEATNKAVKWESNNPEVVSVDSNGNLVATGIGSAEITVSTLDDTISDVCTVTVSGRVLKGTLTTGDRAVEGAEVSLYVAEDDFTEAVATTHTTSSGEYQFSELGKGNYRVKVEYNDGLSDYVTPESDIAIAADTQLLNLECEKVTSLSIEVVDYDKQTTPVLYVRVLVEGYDMDGHKWSQIQETNGAGIAKFILPENIQSEITYTLMKSGYEEETYTDSVQELVKTSIKQTIKKETKAKYPEVIEHMSETEGTNPNGLGDTTYEALKAAGWRVESATKLSTNSRNLIFENLNGEDGLDAKVIYTRGFESEDIDYEVLLKYMIRKQSDSTSSDLTFEELIQTIEHGTNDALVDGTRTIKIQFDGKINPTITLIFSNYSN